MVGGEWRGMMMALLTDVSVSLKDKPSYNAIRVQHAHAIDD